MLSLIAIGGFLYLVGKDGAEMISFNAFDSLFMKYARQYGLDWKMIKAISMNESGLGGGFKNGLVHSVFVGLRNPLDVEGSKSSDGKSWGLMQVTLTTARDYDPTATPQKLNDPEYSIKLACQLIAWLTVNFKNDPRSTEWIVKAYNQGIGNTMRERRGEIKGYAKEYFERYLRNYAKLTEVKKA
jgi:membrane-bound lytic murein transglycosylase MltF